METHFVGLRLGPLLVSLHHLVTRATNIDTDYHFHLCPNMTKIISPRQSYLTRIESFVFRYDPDLFSEYLT